MVRLKQNISDVQGTKIELSTLTDVYNQDYIIETNFVEQECKNAINEIVDFDNVRYTPVYEDMEVCSIKFVLKEDLVTPRYYSDYNITDDDIRLRYNRYTNSFLRLQFYRPYSGNMQSNSSQNNNSNTLLFPEQGQLMGQSSLYNRTYNTDTSNNTEVYYETYNPKKKQPPYKSEGFYIYNNKQSPTNLYMTASYNNAVNGIIHPLSYSPYDNNLVTTNNFIEVEFNSENKTYNFLNNQNNVVTYNPINKQIEICLF